MNEIFVSAGTPGFLVNGIDNLKASNYPILEADSDKMSTLWELGEVIAVYTTITKTG